MCRLTLANLFHQPAAHKSQPCGPRLSAKPMSVFAYGAGVKAVDAKFATMAHKPGFHQDRVHFCMALALGLALLAAANPPARALLQRLGAINIFIVFLWCVTPLTTPGTPLAQWGMLTVSAEGVRLALLVSIKSNAIACIFLALVATMTVEELEQNAVRPVGIIVADVNGLKMINDYLGHEEGNTVLCQAALLLRGGLDSAACVARMSNLHCQACFAHYYEQDKRSRNPVA